LIFEHNGKTGEFVKVRDDDKYSIKFDDGKRLAANPKNVFKFDENGNRKDWWHEDYEDDGDENINYGPEDFYFYVRRYGGAVYVTLTSAKYFEENGCVDDGLGSHNLSREVKDALKRAGVYADAEESEAVWSVNPRLFNPAQIRMNMLKEGFIDNPAFTQFMRDHN